MNDSSRSRMVSKGQFEAVSSLAESGVSSVKPQKSFVDAEAYLDSNIFSIEQSQLFLKLPVPLLLSQELSAPCTYIGLEFSGRSIIVTRNKAGRVKAFINACRHRGSRLVACDQATAGLKFTCPYHAWTYNLDGQLLAVPREDSFLDLDKNAYRLKELPCQEEGGFIWVSFDAESRMDRLAIGAGLIGDFEAIGLSGMKIFRSASFDLNANWKLLTDAFLESYHVTRLHAKTLARFFIDSPQVIERVDQHIRQSSGSRRGFNPGSLSPVWAELRKSVVYSYIVFPNVIVVTSPTYVNVVILAPERANRTKARYMMLVDGGSSTPQSDALYERSFQLMLEAFGNEDFKAAEGCQIGLENGALSRVTLGGMEQGVRVFHDLIEEYALAYSAQTETAAEQPKTPTGSDARIP